MGIKNQVAIYKSKTGKVGLRVKLKKGSVWLNLNQISKLFDTDKSGVSRHIKNIYKTKELSSKSTVAKIATVQREGERKITRSIEYYNLDLIISIGYRINSLRATQFRIWATNILKKYLVKGYAINKTRLLEQQESLKTLSENLAIIKSKIQSPLLAGQESELFQIVKNYIDSLRILKLYDDQLLTTGKLTSAPKFALEYENAIQNINYLKTNLQKQNLASDNFGLENSHKLKGLIGAISQTFDNRDLYPSIEEKAAHLLYFVIKDHPFVDGNKRIGSTLFIYFLSKNNYLFKTNGEAKINDRALVALALLVAVSDPDEKDTLIKLIINLIKN
jgi:death-on-curing family protein